MASNESKFWYKAMMEELDLINKINVWELVQLPKCKVAIGCKWVYKKKLRSDGTLDKYKARLVAKRYTQKLEIDYEGIHSPVAKYVSIRIIMAIVAKLDLKSHQLDVKTTFLNGKLKEDIYMQRTDGFEVKRMEDKVYKLHKSLYGLKLSSR